MGFHVSIALAELWARRMRMRKAMRDFTASLLEFFLLGGLLVGLIGPFLMQKEARVLWLGLLPIGGAIIGYGLLELRRQSLADPPSRAFDLLTLALFLAMAALGYALLAMAFLQGPDLLPAEIIEAPPADYVPLELLHPPPAP